MSPSLAQEDLETRRTGQIAVSVLAALLMIGGLLFHWAGQPEPAITDAGFNLNRVDSSAPRPSAPAVSVAAAAGSPLPTASGLAVVPSPSAEPAAAPAVAPSAAAQPSQTPAARDANAVGLGALTPQEQLTLSGVVGRLDAKTATKIGSQTGLTSILALKLVEHPKVMRFLLDNSLVVKAIEHQDKFRRVCSDPSTLQGYLSDGNASDGVGRMMDLLKASTQVPGATEAVTGSAAATALAGDCGSLPKFATDPAAVAQAAKSNPELMKVLTDPTVVSALGKNAVTGQVGMQLLETLHGVNGIPDPATGQTR